ncbi:MAG: DUF3021 domain-containing protein [Roseburia sp.]|nr:DUF3021 domain-containing protein [Roseburia sp.]MCM1243581.1 DUF3021 domain-containing protein [Roseburia sp.]
MKKKIIMRGVLGLPIGITIGYLITIIISLGWAEGYYAPCVPELVTVMGSEIKAVMVQALLCGLLGVGFGISGVIWEIEEWSIVKQTGIYFLIVSVIMMPAAYLTYWMEHSIAGFLSYFGIFAVIFVIVWVIMFVSGRRNVRKLNDGLYRNKEEGGGCF